MCQCVKGAAGCDRVTLWSEAAEPDQTAPSRDGEPVPLVRRREALRKRRLCCAQSWGGPWGGGGGGGCTDLAAGLWVLA